MTLDDDRLLRLERRVRRLENMAISATVALAMMVGALLAKVLRGLF